MANIDKIRLSGVTYNIVDSTAIHSLPSDMATTGDIKTATDALAESIAEQGYQTASDVQTAIAGKADTTAVTKVETDLSALSTTVAGNSTNIANLQSTKIGDAAYDSSTQRINFYDEANGSVLAYIDATDFIKDGMVSNVEISEGNLVITFNSDAGKQPISIPLTDIFNPSNYYTKTEVDNALADKANTATTYTKTEVDNAITAATSTKQDTLVSGTNIKTINNESILGSGNIEIEPAGVVDTVMSSTSENAVQNKVIKAYADTKNPMVTLDGETLVIS